MMKNQYSKLMRKQHSLQQITIPPQCSTSPPSTPPTPLSPRIRLKRSHQPVYEDEGTCNLKLNVTIPSVETFYKDEEPFLVYSVRISHGVGDDVVSWRIFHQFKHFSDLHEQLKQKYPKELLDLQFPLDGDKQIPSSSSSVVHEMKVDEGRIGLQRYLQNIVDSYILRNDEQVKTCLFLRESNFASRYQTLNRLKSRKFPIDVVDPSLDNTSRPLLFKSKSALGIVSESTSNVSSSPIDSRRPIQLKAFHSSVSKLETTPTTTNDPLPSSPRRQRPRANNAAILPNPNFDKPKPRVSIAVAISKPIEFLLKSGLDVHAIFEAPVGDSPKIHIYLKSFRDGLGDFVCFRQPAEAAGCLLAYLVSLPEPLLNYELHLCFLAIDDEPNEDQKIFKLRNLLRTLPSDAFPTIVYVISFFATIADRCKDKEKGLDKTTSIITPLLFQRETMDSDYRAAYNISRIMTKHFVRIMRKSN